MQYKALNAIKNEIRVLTILPRNEADDVDVIRCTLENVSLDQHSEAYATFLGDEGRDVPISRLRSKWMKIPNRQFWDEDKESTAISDELLRHQWGDYGVLSYAWGQPTPAKKVLLNGTDFEATPNLFNALHRLREGGHYSKKFRLWVDALCINQKDIPERNSQVKRMGCLYQLALKCEIWLGEETEDSDPALHLLRELQARARKAVETPDADKPLPRLFELGTRRGQPGTTFRQWLSLYRFLSIPYWRRLWIIQEIFFGYEVAVLRWGSHPVSVQMLLQAILQPDMEFHLMVALMGAALDEAGLGIPAIKILQSTIERSFELVHLCFKEGFDYNGPVLRLLQLSQRSSQTDLRDKVYGILGLINPDVSHQVTVDYNKDVVSVYTEFSRAIILASDNLDFLLDVLMETGTVVRCPSWVTNLAGQRFGRRLRWQDRPYRTTKNSIRHVHFDIPNSRMHCEGVLVDSIKGKTLYRDEEINEAISSDGYTFVSPGANAYGSEQSYRRAIWMSLVEGRDNTGQPPVPESWKALLQTIPNRWLMENEVEISIRAYEDFREFLDSNASFPMNDRTLSEWCEESYLYEGDISAELLEAFYRAQSNLAAGSRLSTTFHGYVGLAPVEAQPGDTIAILYGCSMPVILRRDGQHFIFVGAAYIHGLMDGEAMEWVGSGRCKVERIGLC